MDLNISFYLKAVHGRIAGISTQMEEGTLLFSPFNNRFNLNVNLSDSYFSRLINRRNDVDGAIQDAIQREDVIKYYEKFFSEDIVPKLNPHTGHDLSKEIYTALLKTNIISDQAKQRYISFYESGEEALFLAHTFMYCLSVPNKEKDKSTLSNTETTDQISDKLDDIMNGVKSITGKISNNLANPENELIFEMADNYIITASAKDPQSAFTIRIQVAKPSFPEGQTFDSLLSYLVFSGKTLELIICSIDIFDSRENLLTSVKNKLYTGETVALPDMYTMNHRTSAFSECPSLLCIRARGNSIPLELRNEYDEPILPTYTYHIERDIQGNFIVASFITNDDRNLTICITYKVPKKPHGKKAHNANIQITLKNPDSSLDVLKYYSVLLKMKEAETITFYKLEADGQYSEFISSKGFATDNKTLLRDCKNLYALFKKIHSIEKHFKTTFDVTDMDYNDAYFSETLYDLITKGYSRLTEQPITTQLNSQDIKTLKSQLKTDSHVKWTSEFAYINLFDKTITFDGEYNMCWISHTISFTEKTAEVSADVAVIYKKDGISEKKLERLMQKDPKKN